eukprot:13065715-Alexandrium_andersonii.AAC.1
MAQQSPGPPDRSDRTCGVCGARVEWRGLCHERGAQADWAPLPLDEPQGQLGAWVASEQPSGFLVPQLS